MSQDLYRERHGITYKGSPSDRLVADSDTKPAVVPSYGASEPTRL